MRHRARTGWRARRLGPVVLVPLCLAVAGVWLAWQSGGFFAGATGIATLFFGVACLIWLMLSRRPFSSMSASLGVAGGALVLFAAWTLVSQLWSHAPARALIEFDRALLYVLVVAFFGLAAATPAVWTNIARAVALAFAVVSICGLVTRVLPDVWPITNALHFDRLSYPVSYWNAQGAVAALGIVACVHLASSLREPRVIRALAAGAVPLVAAALLYTFSRGGIAVLPIGLVAYLLLARPRGALSALLAIVPATAVTVLVAYDADAVVRYTTPTARAISEGKTVALVAAVCAVAAAVAMATVARLVDAPMARWRGLSTRQLRALGAAAVVAVVVAGIALHVPREVADRVAGLGKVHFVETNDTRARLTSLGDNGRADQWRVALDSFKRHPILGSGAGTYALLWARDRHIDQEVNDGHSLYLEVLGEMGIVGGVLIVLAVGGLLVGSLLRARGPDRAFGAVAFAVGLMWALHAGIDWDWEMPALTLPVLALMASASGVASAATEAEGEGEAEPEAAPEAWPGRVPRLIAGIALLALLVTPLSIARSQAKLDDASTDLHAGRCDAAISAALASNSALAIRPEPFQILSLCDARLGRDDLALAAAQAALRRDPNSWQLLYGLAVMRAARGLDPRPLLREARRHNPRSELIASAIRRFRTSSPEAWRRRALRTPLPV